MDIIVKLKEGIAAAEEAAVKLYNRIIELFETHPTIDEFHMTSDQQFFPIKDNADFHGSRLTDRGVATITRDQVNGLTDIPAPAALQEGDASLAHPEFTPPTAEELAQKAIDDQSLQAQLQQVIKDKAAADQAAADKAAADQAAADKAAADQAAADKKKVTNDQQTQNN